MPWTVYDFYVLNANIDARGKPIIKLSMREPSISSSAMQNEAVFQEMFLESSGKYAYFKPDIAALTGRVSPQNLSNSSLTEDLNSADDLFKVLEGVMQFDKLNDESRKTEGKE